MTVTDLDPALDGLEEDAPLDEERKPRRGRPRRAGDPGTYTHKLMMEAEARPVVERCFFCEAQGREWKIEAPLVEARAAHEAHRNADHQEEMAAARARPKKKKPKPALSVEQTAEDKRIVSTLAERQRKAGDALPQTKLTDERWATVKTELYDEQIGIAECCRRHAAEFGFAAEKSMAASITRRIQKEGLERPPRGKRTAKVEAGPPPAAPPDPNPMPIDYDALIEELFAGDPEDAEDPERPPPRSRSFMTAEIFDDVVRRYQAGEKLREIAHSIWRECGYRSVDSCENAIVQTMRRRGIELRGREPKPTKFIPVNDPKICNVREAALWRLYEADIGITAIGALVWKLYGFKNAVSGAVQTRKAFSVRGRRLRNKTRIDGLIPTLNRAEAWEIVMEAESRRSDG